MPSSLAEIYLESRHLPGEGRLQGAEPPPPGGPVAPLSVRQWVLPEVAPYVALGTFHAVREHQSNKPKAQGLYPSSSSLPFSSSVSQGRSSPRLQDAELLRCTHGFCCFSEEERTK